MISTPAQQTFSITKYITKAVLFCAVFTGLFVVFSFAKNFVANNFERLAHGIIGTLPGFLATYLFLKFDKQKFSSIGLTFEPYTIARFFCGVAAGVLLMGLLAINVVYFTHATIAVSPSSDFFRFLLMTSPLVPLAFMEQLGFRAYPLEKKR